MSFCKSLVMINRLFIGSSSGTQRASKYLLNNNNHIGLQSLIKLSCNHQSSSSQSCRTLLTKVDVNKVNYCNNNRIINVDKRYFKTSERRDALPPLVVLLFSRLAKFGAVIFGRLVRRWWQKLPAEERANYSKKIGRNRYVISGMLGAIAFGSFVYYETHVQETPFTKRKRFLAFTDSQFNEMAKYELNMMMELHKDKIIPASMQIMAYKRVVYVAQRLLKANQDLPQIHDKEWTITVVDDDSQCNAFVLPCGSIFVFSGLFKICETDDDLGVILGHEMAHAVMGHGAEKASFMHFLDMMLVIPLAALWMLLPTDIIAGIGHVITNSLTKIIMELPHSRFIEHEADQVGLLLAAKSCFDVRQAPVLWDKMSIMGGTEELEWLSTHPSHDKRQIQLEELLPAAIGLRETCHCPRLPHFDPRMSILQFQNKMKIIQMQKKNPHEGLLIPLKIHPKEY